MARWYWLPRLFLFVWCFMHTFTVKTVSAQNATLSLVSLPTGSSTNEVIQLQCNANITQFNGYFFEWRKISAGNMTFVIARNGTTNDSKYSLKTSDIGQTRNQVLTIENVTKTDSGPYTCHVKDINGMMVFDFGSTLVPVFPFFPSAMYPICFPDGPFTVQEGTTVNMSCTTELGNPQVQIHIITSRNLTYSENGNNKAYSFLLTVNTTDNRSFYNCNITSNGTNMERFCTIGPINVVPMTTQSNYPLTTESSQNSHETSPTTTPTKSDTTTVKSTVAFPIAIIAGAAGGGGFLLLILTTLIVLYLCRCCCFDEKSRRSSLWLTELPLAETVQDTNTDHDSDRSKPKEYTTTYQNETDLMAENKPDPRMTPRSEPETSHLDTQDMTNNDDEAAEFISQRQFSIHSQNNDQDSPRSPRKSSFKLSRSDDRITDKDNEEHLGTVEPEEGDAPTYGVVQKSNRVSHGSKKKQPEITSDGIDPWANASLNQQENITPASTENEDAEMPSLLDDPSHSHKPTYMVKPVSHTPKPPIATKPVKDHQSSRRTNTNQAPPSLAKKPIKKFKAKERTPSADETPLPPPVAQSVSPHPPPPSSPLTDGEENASVEGYAEEGSDKVPPDSQVPHEARAADDHDVTYADLDLQSLTSDAMPHPQEEQTLYASIVSK